MRSLLTGADLLTRRPTATARPCFGRRGVMAVVVGGRWWRGVVVTVGVLGLMPMGVLSAGAGVRVGAGAEVKVDRKSVV